jgi:hypothetical protein
LTEELLAIDSKAGLLLAILCAASMWFYVDHVLVPYQRADAAVRQRPRGNLSDLYPRWLGARELLLHRRNPYNRDITREIQAGYYGRELDPQRPGDPKDEQGFAYPVYVTFLLAPTIRFPFDEVRTGFAWFLVVVTAASVLLWLRVVGWRLSTAGVLIVLLLTLGSFPAVQGFKLQQLSLVVAAFIAMACALLTQGHLFSSGVVLALATIKPQLTLPIVLFLLLWTLSDWPTRQRFFWGCAATMALLLAASEILLPGWIGNFLVATQAYRRYAGGMSMLDVLLTPLWGRIASTSAIAVTAVVCWRLRKEPNDSPQFALAIALVLAVTVIVIPMFAPYNYLLLVPAVLVIARNWRTLSNRSAPSRTALYLAAAAVAWPWVATIGLCVASLFLAPEIVQRGWWLPLYTSAKVPIPLVVLVPLSILVAQALAQGRLLLPSKPAN